MSLADQRLVARFRGAATQIAQSLIRRHDSDPEAHAGVVATHDADLTAHGLEDTGWINASLQNGWANYGAPFETVQYRRKNGIVYIQGFCNSAGNRAVETIIFTLPAGFRPQADKHQPILTDTGTGATRVKIQSNGEFRVNSIGASTWVSFTNISFPADN